MTNMTNIEKLRAKLSEAQNRKESTDGTKSFSSDSPYFPFWQLETGQSVTIRLFEDADPSNDFPFIEKRMVRLPFGGVVGNAESDNVTVEVPSMTTWDTRAKDPIVEATRKYWDSKGDETNIPLARLYHYKRTFLYQGVVVGGDLVDAGRENDVRIFSFNKSLHDAIVSFLMDPELEHLPMDAEHGRDLTITKGKQGEYANYSVKFSVPIR